MKRTIQREVEDIYQMKVSNSHMMDIVKDDAGKETGADTYDSFKSSSKSHSKNDAIYAPDGYLVGRSSLTGDPTIVFNKSIKRKSHGEHIPINILTTPFVLEQR